MEKLREARDLTNSPWIPPHSPKVRSSLGGQGQKIAPGLMR